MTLRLALVVAAAAVAWVFALLTLRQYLLRRRPPQLWWAGGVFFFALAVTLQLVPLGQGGWTPGWYRLWYYCGALVNVVLLGHGTAVLLLRPRAARLLTLVALSALTLSAAIVWSAPLNISAVAGEDLLTGKAFASISEGGLLTPRAWAPLLNSYGTFWLFGGAAWSAWIFWRRRGSRQRAYGTALIAGGALVLALTSTLTNFFFTGFEEIGRLAGVCLLFAGFVAASRPAPAAAKVSGQAVSAT